MGRFDRQWRDLLADGLVEFGISAWLSRTRGQFLAFVRSRVASAEAAEDILQSAMLKAAEAEGGIESPERAEAWFYRVLRNAVVDYYRRSALRARTFADEWEALSLMPAPRAVKVCPCVSRELPGLKPEYVRALEQVEMEGGSVQEFAKREGIAAGNASVRLHRARHALRRRLMECCGSCAGAGCFDCTCS